MSAVFPNRLTQTRAGSAAQTSGAQSAPIVRPNTPPQPTVNPMPDPGPVIAVNPLPDPGPVIAVNPMPDPGIAGGPGIQVPTGGGVKPIGESATVLGKIEGAVLKA